jgi:biotin operon repressor
VTDQWHQLKAAIEQESELPGADRHTFLYLMDHGHHYKTAAPQADFAPSLDVIAKRTGQSRRQVAYSIRHLEQHGWIEVVGHVGREHRNIYALAVGKPCECTGRRHTASSRSATETAQPGGATSSRSATEAPVAVQRGSATPQLRQGFSEESTRSELGFTPADEKNEPLKTGDRTTCSRCGAEGIVGVRLVVHDPACAWLAVARLYEAER